MLRGGLKGIIAHRPRLSRKRLLCKNAFIRCQRRAAESFGHAPVGRAPIAISPHGTRHLFQPVVDVDSTKVVEVVARQFNRFPHDTIEDAVRTFRLKSTVARGPVHHAVHVGQALGAFADQVADGRPLLERQLEALEELGAVNRVKQARGAQHRVRDPWLSMKR